MDHRVTGRPPVVGGPSSVGVGAHQSELEAVYQAAPIGLGLFDRELRYVRVNELLAEMTGVPREELIGRRLADVVTAETMARISPAYEHVLATGEPVFNLEIAGEITAEPLHRRCWQASLHPHRGVDGAVLGVNTVVKEVTDRKHREQMTAGLLEAASALSAVSTVGEVVGVVIRAAESLLAARSAVLGVVDEQGLLLHFDRSLHPGIEPWRRSESGPVAAAMRTGKRVVVRSPAELRESFPMVAEAIGSFGVRAVAAVPLPSVLGGPAGGLAVDFSSERELDDIEWDALTVLASRAAEAVARAGLFEAERRARERAQESELKLAEAEERLRLAVRAADLDLWQVDLDGQRSWRDSTVQVLGHDAGPAPSFEVGSLGVHVVEGDLPTLELAVERAMNPSGDGVLAVEFRTLGPGGEISWRVVHGHVFCSDHPVRRPLRAVGVMIDVTAEKEAEAARRAEHRDRLEREFVANASHELRTPVTVLIGAVEALQRPEVIDEPDLRARFLGHLGTETGRLKRLTDTLLLLAQADSPDGLAREVVPIKDLLQRVVADVSPAPGVTLGVDAPSITIETCAVLLEVAVGNLVRNAARYTTSGAIYVRGRVDPQGLLIEVADTGPGMPPGTLARAFDRFYRGVPRSAEGFGLGLSIATRAAEALGVSLHVESMLGVGTTAQLRFPPTAT